MPSHSKPDLSVSALLRNLNEELDRKKMQNVDDLLLSKAQGSVRRRLGSRVHGQDVEISRKGASYDLYGCIFMCNRRTWKECLGQCLFGLPIGKKSLVEQVVPGMKLFLFEYEHRQLWGVFEAISHGAMDIIPDAYTGGSFPCQVRVKVPEDCVALYEDEFYNVLKDNYFSAEKFHFDLTRRQVSHLISLFERKYLRAKGMEPNLIEYENRQCIGERYDPIGPLFLTDEDSHVYSVDRNTASLQHNLYNSGCQIIQDGSFLESDKGMGFLYRNIENLTSKTGNRTKETNSYIPFSNGIVQGNCLPLNVDVTRFTNIGAQLGDFGTGDLIPVYSTLTKQETIETVVVPGNVSRLHSDRPVGKSVWARISGRVKPLMAAEISQKQGKFPVSSTLSLPPPPKLPAEAVVVEISSSPMQDECKSDVPVETAEFSIGFKRRRVPSNNASANANETQTGKRRRKLTRPFFEASADEPSAENAACHPTKIDLNIPPESQEGFINLDQQNDHLTDVPIVESRDQEPCALALRGFINSEQGNERCKDVSLVGKREQETCALAIGGSINSEQPLVRCKDVSLGEEIEQEPCALALSLCTQPVELLPPRAEMEIELTSNKQNSPEALVLVQTDKQDRMSHPEDLLSNCVSLPKQVDKADGEHAELGSGTFGVKQFFDLLPHISSDLTSLESMEVDSSRANTLSLAPCTPAKEVVGSSGLAMSLVDEGQGLAVKCQNSENCTEAAAHGMSNGVSNKESETISLDCTAGSTLLNSVGLKSILNGLQVSGIKLQLGSSPCLILQLGDSSCSVDNQDQEGAIQTCPEVSLKGPPSSEILLQRPSSS